MLLTAQQAVVATTMSDGSGVFVVNNVVAGEYVVRVEAAGFRTQQVAVHYIEGSGAIAITIGCRWTRRRDHRDGLPGVAEDTGRTVQRVSVISHDDIQRRVGTVVAQAVAEEAGVHVQQTSPTMAGHLHSRSHREQGERVRGWRALLERGAARRREYVSEPHRSIGDRHDRDPARAEQRRVWQRRTRRHRSVPDAHARALCRPGGP